MKELDALVGAWRSSGETVGDPVVRIEGSDVYEWLPGGHFLLHHVDVTLDGRRYRALEVFEDGLARSYDSDGATGTMTVGLPEPGVVTLTGADTRARLVVETDRMAATWERLDEGRWRHWMDMQFTRESAPRSPAAATP